MDASRYVAVVDDERSVALAVGRLICSAGFSVKTFTSGADFLPSLEQRRPDCVVSDLHMRDMSGLLLLQLLSSRAPGLPVIIMSGQDAMDGRTKAIAAGAHEYLVKPVDEALLLEAIGAAVPVASTAVIIPWEPRPRSRAGVSQPLRPGPPEPPLGSAPISFRSGRSEWPTRHGPGGAVNVAPKRSHVRAVDRTIVGGELCLRRQRRLVCEAWERGHLMDEHTAMLTAMENSLKVLRTVRETFASFEKWPVNA